LAHSFREFSPSWREGMARQFAYGGQEAETEAGGRDMIPARTWPPVTFFFQLSPSFSSF
jgi:hypothetical protein